MIVFGGYAMDFNIGYLKDTWTLNLDGTPTWTLLDAGTGPSIRESAQGVYDATGHRLVVQGGYIYPAGALTDTWALSLAGAPSWTRLAQVGPDRYDAAAVYDPSNDRMLIFGGATGNAAADGSIFALPLSPGGAWSAVTPGAGPTPGNRANVAGVIDGSGRFVVFSGWTGANSTNDAWVVPATAGASWLQLRPNAPRVDERRDASVVWDPVRHRGLLYGGMRESGVTDEIWALDGPSAEWAPLPAASIGYVVIARLGASAIWDTQRDRMIVFGGSTTDTYQNSVVEFAGATSVWSLVPTSTSPVRRMYAAGAYDPVRDRMIYFAGYPLANCRTETWSLALGGATAVWTLLTPSGTPPGQRYGHTMTYDPVRDRILMFGGGDGVSTSDFYALSLSGSGAWSAINGPGTPPPARRFHSASYDPVQDRLLVWGGNVTGHTYLNDTWEYRFDGTGWRQLDLAISPPGLASSGFYDPERRRLTVFGGQASDGLRRDTWTLDLDGPSTGVPGDAARLDFALSGAMPNPAVRAPRISLTLPDATPATLDLVDLAGRRVRTRDVGALGAGRHLVDLGQEGALAPGLYFARLTRAGTSVTAKVCVAR
jgi:hypothetical protein